MENTTGTITEKNHRRTPQCDRTLSVEKSHNYIYRNLKASENEMWNR